jgi:hypothetical protein
MFLSRKPDSRAFYSLSHLPHFKRRPGPVLFPSNQLHANKIDVSYGDFYSGQTQYPDATCCESMTYIKNKNLLPAQNLRSPIRRGKTTAQADVCRQCRPQLRGQHINSY